MGERVAVGRVTPAEPINEPAGGRAGGPPIDYGRGDRAGDAWRWARASGAAFTGNVRRAAGPFVGSIGGWRRVGFALGLAMVLGGLGDCIGGSGGGGAFWMFLGGLLIGFTARVPLLNDRG